MKAALLIVLSLLHMACRSQTSIHLVDQGKAVSAIYLSSEASSSDKQAALVLQDYFKRMSGASLPVESVSVDGLKTIKNTGVFIGKDFFESEIGTLDVKDDGFALASVKDRLYLAGLTGKGSLYAAYELLERYLHCIKLDQGPAEVPKQENISILEGIRLFESPDFAYRESFYPASLDNEYLDWHRLHRFEDLWGLWGHSFFKLLPPDEYFNDHPEYYAFTEGQRRATQLCLSNSEVIRLVKDRLQNLMVDRPEATYWSIAPMDGSGYCTCDECSAVDREEGGPQGSLIRFVNTIASNFSNKKFTTLAYGYSANAPKKTKPAPNVSIFISSIESNRQIAIPEDPASKNLNRQILEWSAITQNLLLWDYTTQFTAYLNPFPMYDVWAPNLNYFSKFFKGVFSQGSGYTYGDMAELACYTQAELLWNVNADDRQLRNDFVQAYYGKAATSIGHYLEALINFRDESHARLDIYGNPVLSRKDYLSDVNIDRLSGILDQAEASVEEQIIFQQRVARVRLGLEYAVLEQSKSLGKQQGGYLEYEPDGVIRVKARWPPRVQAFTEASERAGVSELAEEGPGPTDYLQSWNKIFGQVTNNKSLVQDVIPQLENTFIPDYPANGAATLTDGLRGTEDYSINWLLFDGVDLIATFRLKEKLSILEVTVEYLEDSRHYILPPKKAFIEVSDDGKKYQVVGQADLKEAVESGSSTPRQLSIKLPKTQYASYIRIRMVNPKVFPNWFEGNRSRKPAIAVSEISISAAR